MFLVPLVAVQEFKCGRLPLALSRCDLIVTGASLPGLGSFGPTGMAARCFTTLLLGFAEGAHGICVVMVR